MVGLVLMSILGTPAALKSEFPQMENLVDHGAVQNNVRPFRPVRLDGTTLMISAGAGGRGSMSDLRRIGSRMLAIASMTWN
jgi:hypothetical protein